MPGEVAHSDQANGERAMFTWTIGQERMADSQKWVSAKTMRLAGLFGALILMSVVVNTLVILASGSMT
jgi:hypothetical protein